MNESIPCSIWMRDNQYWVIPQHTYNGFALDRYTFERVSQTGVSFHASDMSEAGTGVPVNQFNTEFAKLNATRCTYTQSLYVLRKFYEKHKIEISLIVGE
jgi:hypothetical protein